MGDREALASPFGGGGVYVPPVEKMLEKDYSAFFTPEQMRPHPESEFIPFDARMARSEQGILERKEAEKKWYNLFGHEVGHLPKGWQYDNPIDAIKASMEGGSRKYNPYIGVNPFFGESLDPTDERHYGGEEIWNHLHDYMYGIGGGADPSYLTGRGLMSLPTPVFGGRFGKRIGSTPGGWNPNTYNKIRNSGLVPWQQGVLMQGPTTAAGQVALKQKPEEVKAQGQAYMDPNRGNVQAPTMTYEEIKKEADRTGGTRHAGEMTKAAGQGGGGQGGGGGGQAAGQRPSRTSRPSGYAAVRKYGRADGGMVGMDYLTRRL